MRFLTTHLTKMKIQYKYDSQKEVYVKGVKQKGWWLGFKEKDEKIPP